MMKTKLITALRSAANALEKGTVFYDWAEQGSCNCGVLFCALTNRSAADLNELVPKRIDDSEYAPTWTTLVGQYCPIAGISTNALFRELMSFGLTQEDIQHMEYLSSKDVLARMTVTLTETYDSGTWPFNKKRVREFQATPKKLDYKNKSSVIAYMRAWADLLQEQGRLDLAPAQAEVAIQSR